MDDMRQDVKEIKSTVMELVKQGAVHNELLREHERRSLALEAQMQPVKRHVDVVETILKYGSAIAIGVTIQFIIRIAL